MGPYYTWYGQYMGTTQCVRLSILSYLRFVCILNTFCNIYNLYHFKACFVGHRQGLDGVLFRTVFSQNKFRSDNVCIIKSIFIPRLGNEPEEIVVECDWYEKVGDNTFSMSLCTTNKVIDTSNISYIS